LRHWTRLQQQVAALQTLHTSLSRMYGLLS